MKNSCALVLLGVLSLGVSSCSSEGDVLEGMPDEPDRAGTRLKVVYQRWLSEDGAQVTIPTNRFLDTKLSLQCSFHKAEDGLTRCIPAPINYVEGSSNFNSDYFLDPACTQGLFIHGSCGPRPDHVIRPVPNTLGCGPSLPQIYKVGPEVTPATVYKLSGTCTALTAAELAAMFTKASFYTATAMAATEFVKGELKALTAP